MTRLARILLPAALATLAIGACVPAPTFHGADGGDAAPPDAPPPGPLTVTVQSRDGGAHPSQNAKVTVADPSGELRHDFTDAAGNVTLMAASGATVFVEDPALVGEQMLVAVLGAQPGDHLQIGAPQRYFDAASTISIGASADDTMIGDYFWATSPCGSATSAVTLSSIDFPLTIDSRCTSGFDILFVELNASTSVPVQAGLKHVSPGTPTVDFVGATTPPRQTQVVYTGLDQVGDIVTHLAPLADGRRLFDFAAETSVAPTATQATATDRFAPSNDTLFEIASVLASSDTPRGAQLVRERRPWPPPVGDQLDVDASAAQLAPWTGGATIAAPNVIAWPESGGGDAVFVLVELRTVDDNGIGHLVRAIAPRGAVTAGGFAKELTLALPAGFEAYAADPTRESTVTVSQYHFEPGVTYDRVRALADWNASPQNELGYGPDILYVAIAGLSL